MPRTIQPSTISHQLIIELRRRTAVSIDVLLRARSSDEDDDYFPAGHRWITIKIPQAALFDSSTDLTAYARKLTAALFRQDTIRDAFVRELGAAESHGRILRVVLACDHEDISLHALRWELLHHPLKQAAPYLALHGRVLFSRRLFSTERRRRPVLHRARIRTLIVIAAPTNLPEFGLAPIVVADELVAADPLINDPKGRIEPYILASGQGATGATLAAIRTALSDEIDALYLVCHGVFGPAGPALALEGSDGKVDWVNGDRVIQTLTALEQLPSLIVLASCQSAGQSDQVVPAARNPSPPSPLVALGPRLADLGVPAVIAMHDNVGVAAVHAFTPAFFHDLLRHGRIDSALAAARATLYASKQDDWWRPVLYLHLGQGQLWVPLEEAVPEPRLVAAAAWKLLRTLLQDTAWTYEQLTIFFRRSVGETPELPTLRDPLEVREWMLRLLGDLGPHHNDIVPLIGFVERLAANAASARTMHLLRDWTDVVAQHMGVDPQQIEDLRVRVVDEGEAVADQRPSYLMISLTPDELDPEQYQVSAWVSSLDTETLCIAADDDPLALNELPERLASLTARAHGLGINTERDLTVELIVPHRLYDKGLDAMALSSRSGPAPAAFQGRVVLRSHERVYSPHLHASWQASWERFSAPNSLVPTAALRTFATLGPFRGASLSDELTKAGALMLVVTPDASSPHPDQRGELVRAMLRAGVPAALWARPKAWGADVAGAFLSPRPADHRALWTQVAATRSAAWGAEDDTVARHVTLIWDDPTRMPPDAISGSALTAPRP